MMPAQPASAPACNNATVVEWRMELTITYNSEQHIVTKYVLMDNLLWTQPEPVEFATKIVQLANSFLRIARHVHMWIQLLLFIGTIGPALVPAPTDFGRTLPFKAIISAQDAILTVLDA
jgi:hypothetical protein